MDRQSFRAHFSADTIVVLPVIHVLDVAQTISNIQVAIDGGCHGVFLINHDFGIDKFLPIIKAAREAHPSVWIALNFLSVTGKYAFPMIADLEKEGTRIDGYWADDARIDEHSSINHQTEATEILSIKSRLKWDGLYFGGTAFKKQREVDEKDYATSATIACSYMDVVTTSGIATGKAADTAKIKTFRIACKESPIALASGLTPENIGTYKELIDCAMVATGINYDGDFYNIDPQRLQKFMENLGN